MNERAMDDPNLVDAIRRNEELERELRREISSRDVELLDTQHRLVRLRNEWQSRCLAKSPAT